jgi:hypothetical protein
LHQSKNYWKSRSDRQESATHSRRSKAKCQLVSGSDLEKPIKPVKSFINIRLLQYILPLARRDTEQNMANLEIEDLGRALPKSLDEIVRANRKLVSLYLSTDEQISELSGAIGKRHKVKDEIEDWRFITLDIKEHGMKIMLLGYARQRSETWITSTVEVIDFESMLAQTANSVYRLVGKRVIGEPPLNHLLHVCHWFHSTDPGMADFFGILNIYY